jgi:hypothetical protein
MAIDIEDVGSLAARDEGRRAAYAAEGPHRRVDAAGNDLLRPQKGGFGFGMGHVLQIFAN